MRGNIYVAQPSRAKPKFKGTAGGKVIAALINTADPVGGEPVENPEAAPGILGLQLHVPHASSKRDFEAHDLEHLGNGALLITSDGVQVKKGSATAKAFGLTVQIALLGRADEVIK